MPSRHLDWLRQAKRDLEHARHALRDGIYEWACFASQQAAEKAVKAVFMKRGADAWGHSVAALLASLPSEAEVAQELVEKGKELDKHYIPPRYPNSHPQGAPLDYYTKGEAERAIDNAGDIIRFCEGNLS